LSHDIGPVRRRQRLRVVDVVPFEEEESPFVGLLQIEAAA
jgi:hypothetical protein